MEKTFLIIIWILMSALCLDIAWHARRRNHSRPLILMMILSTGVQLSYLGSVLVSSYVLMSLLNSIYFILIDCVLLSLVAFCHEITRSGKSALQKVLRKVSLVYTFFDACVLFINVFKEIAISYSYETDSLAHWRFIKYPLYNMHLTFCYLLIIWVIALLSWKILRTPAVYHSRYHILIGGVLFVVAMNALFLFPHSNMLDISVLFYGVMGAVFYWNQYFYSSKGMHNAARQMLIEDFGHGLVLFDYENLFTLCNKEANGLIAPEKQNNQYTIEEFIKDNNLSSFIPYPDSNVSFQCHLTKDGILSPFRCDYKSLRDARSKVIGRIFVFTDLTTETDLLTGFYNESSFLHRCERGEFTIGYPSTVTVCDLNRLSYINSTRGRETGDRAIQFLADTMRSVCASDSLFVRLHEANLMVICSGTSQNHMRHLMEQISDQLANQTIFEDKLEIQFAIANLTREEPDILKAKDAAFQSVKARKLLDQRSAHTSLINILAQTQLEGDQTTEAHVRRTQDMGNKLGLRLGLSDIELSNLSLLCLLHDIGKVGIPLEILNKPGALTKEEWDVMKTHVDKGYRIAMATEELRGIADLILHHHEKWDGTGYPDNLKQEEIPLLSRIISVVDTFDAMTHDRPYRQRLSAETALNELLRCAGKQFDPYIATEFSEMIKEDNASLSDIHAATEPPVQNPPTSFVFTDELPNPDAKISLLHFSRYVLDKDLTIIETDDSFEELTGYTKEDIKNYHLRQIDLILPEEQNDYLRNISKNMTDENGLYVEHRLRRKDGSSRFVFCYGRQYYDPIKQQPRSAILITDVSKAGCVQALIAEERQSARRNYHRWEDSLRHDPLTGLLNRVAFQNDIQLKLLEKNEQVVMIMCDVDNFKNYNDTHGHWKGDQLLKLYGHILKNQVKDLGTASRMGGDEFGAMLCFALTDSREQIEQTLVDFSRKLSEELAEYDSHITISMGAVIAKEDDTFNQLYKKTDEALYRAKEAGKNRLAM